MNPEQRLLPICRCDDCTNLLYEGLGVRAKCHLTGRRMRPQKYENEGFPKDCPLKKAKGK